MTIRARSLFVALVAVAVACNVGGAVATDGVVVHRDVNYDLGTPPAPPSGPQHNRLDIYAPAGAADLPVVVWVHGGSWMRGDKANHMEHKPRLFTDAGMVFVSVNYRLSPDPPAFMVPDRVRFPDHPHDVAEALAWLHDHVGPYGGDPDRMLLVGHSAGAHVVSLVATDPRHLQGHGTPPDVVRGAVALDSAAFDIAAELHDDPTPQQQALFYNAFANPVEERLDPRWQAGSPQHHADPSDPPFLLVTQDVTERIQRNRAFAEALGLAADSAVLVLDKTHAEINRHLGDPADDSPLTARVLAFARDRLEPTS